MHGATATVSVAFKKEAVSRSNVLNSNILYLINPWVVIILPGREIVVIIQKTTLFVKNLVETI